MKFPPVRDQCLEMIRVALTDAAYDAIASTLPKGAARWPMQRDANASTKSRRWSTGSGLCAARGESWSDVILRVAAEGA